MKIGGFQRTSLIEYPGKISVVVFTQGCNFRCHYCHNPELVLPELFGPLIPSEEIFDFLKKRPLLEAVTITGGEPCLQEDLMDFLRQLRSYPVAIKLNTNGSLPEVLKLIINQSLVDYLSLDIKAALSRYEKVVGVPVKIENLRRSVELVKSSGLEYDFRTTVVPDLLRETDIHTIGQLIQGARRHIFQRFVPSKTVNPEFLQTSSPSREQLEKLRQIMAQYVEQGEIIY
ncbi:MAG: anaerobic ribonucleoside-triphosphate reductase activating protein [Candidatus Omnitrophica bacterium]|nr:anaerobic ribonucleoside-triphosphate reductase activating protein [Candidatus Omnitrophota bacterium]